MASGVAGEKTRIRALAWTMLMGTWALTAANVRGVASSLGCCVTPRITVGDAHVEGVNAHTGLARMYLAVGKKEGNVRKSGTDRYGGFVVECTNGHCVITAKNLQKRWSALLSRRAECGMRALFCTCCCVV